MEGSCLWRRVLGSKEGFEDLLWAKISVEEDKIPIVESRISGGAQGSTQEGRRLGVKVISPSSSPGTLESE